MALYDVKNKKTGERNLVEASTPSGALRRAAMDMFDVQTISSPTEAASIVAQGTPLLREVAEDADAAPAPDAVGEKDKDG